MQATDALDSVRQRAAEESRKACDSLAALGDGVHHTAMCELAEFAVQRAY